MQAKDARGMTEKEIDAALTNARQELFNLRFRMAAGQLSDTSRLGIVRRDVARLLTVRRQRERDAARPAGGER